jgi:hypothetical protein
VVQALAKDLSKDPKEVRRSLEASGQMTSLAGDIIRDRALSLVVEHADVVSEGRNASEATAEGET